MSGGTFRVDVSAYEPDGVGAKQYRVLGGKQVGAPAPSILPRPPCAVLPGAYVIPDSQPGMASAGAVKVKA